MSKSPFFYFRLDAHQGAMIIGLFETLQVLHVYLGFLTFVSMLTQGFFEYMGADSNVSDSLPMAIFVFSLIFAVVALFPLLLSVGAVQGKRWLMLPWLILCWARAVVSAFCVLSMAYHLQFMVMFYMGALLAETLYALHVVTSSFSLLGRSKSQTEALANTEKVVYVNF